MATARINTTTTTNPTRCFNGNHKFKPESDWYLTRIKSCLCYGHCFPLLAKMLEESVKEEHSRS